MSTSVTRISWILGVLVLVLIAGWWLHSSSSTSGLPADGSQVLRDRAQSPDGTAELLDFQAALKEGNWVQAAQYVEPNCQEDCLFTQEDAAQIAQSLKEACTSHFCGAAVLSQADPDADPRLNHTLQSVTTEGTPQRFCLDEDCTIQKTLFSMRVHRVNDLWYVLDLPPVSPRLP